MQSKKQIDVPGGLDGSSCSLPCGESVRGLFGSSLTAELGLLAWELDSSDVTGPGVSINMWPMCVTCGPFELDVELPLDDSVNGFNLSISCGFEPDTGKFRRFNSTLRSLTERIAFVTVNSLWWATLFVLCLHRLFSAIINLSSRGSNLESRIRRLHGEPYLSCPPACPKASRAAVPRGCWRSSRARGLARSCYFR